MKETLSPLAFYGKIRPCIECSFILFEICTLFYPAFMSKFTFSEFVAKFPALAMPVTLGEDTHHAFSAENEPLSEEMAAQFIEPLLSEPFDEFTEVVPCFAIENTMGFVALVWWKAGLLEYEYTLATFMEQGLLIDKATVAFTRVKDGRIFRSVATIDPDHMIFMALGDTSTSETDVDPRNSRMETLEIMGDGKIV